MRLILILIIIINYIETNNSFDQLPDSETFGQCSKQSEIELHKRNCRYGKCENVKNGTDFVCHCDPVS